MTVTAAVEAYFAWPNSETEVEYDGHTFVLKPRTELSAPTVSITLPGHTDDDYRLGERLINRLLSALTWVHHLPAGVLTISGWGQDFPMNLDIIDPEHYTHDFETDYLPVVTDSRAALALALYREAMFVNSVPYKFLGFAKVLNVVCGNGTAQKQWINVNAGQLRDGPANDRLTKLEKSCKNIGEYLWVQGRCAVAHAFEDPLVDPDAAQDLERLRSDTFIMQALAERLIEKELGIRTWGSWYRDHHFEVDGFRRLLGEALLSKIIEGTCGERDILPTFPLLSVRLRNHQPFNVFENMRVTSTDCQAGTICLHLESADQRLVTEIVLDFGRWELQVDPNEKTRLLEDGSPEAMRNLSDSFRFRAERLANGEVEVYDARESVLLGRTRRYMPTVPMGVDFPALIDKLRARSLDALREAEAREKQRDE